jgi:hypothetical protein
MIRLQVSSRIEEEERNIYADTAPMTSCFFVIVKTSMNTESSTVKPRTMLELGDWANPLAI